MSGVVGQQDLRRLAADWMARGATVAGPVRTLSGGVLYSALDSPGALLLEGFVRPRNSIKEFFFPRHERLFGYRVLSSHVELDDAEPDPKPQLILGARPCDAAALEILDRVFNWDFADPFYNRRREASTVVTIACAEHDDACFCTSVGLAPDSERGADAVLAPLGGGRFEVRAVTEKGRALIAGQTEPSEARAPAAVGPAVRFSAGAARAFVRDRFEDPFWTERTLACFGCGVCAYTCPACHCFDIVDECGARVKNWDSCQFPLFTLHASGHNPRPAQGARQRQRIYHKFHVYPEKFGEILCTGCGNCARNCPAGLGVLPLLEAIGNG